jgi:hypothetical protein
MKSKIIYIVLMGFLITTQNHAAFIEKKRDDLLIYGGCFTIGVVVGLFAMYQYNLKKINKLEEKITDLTVEVDDYKQIKAQHITHNGKDSTGLVLNNRPIICNLTGNQSKPLYEIVEEHKK